MVEEFLAERSRELLKNQLDSIDHNNSKAATITTIAALFVPICFSLVDEFSGSNIWIFFFFIPIAINLIGIYFLVLSMFPRSMFHGIHFSQFDNLLKQGSQAVLLTEIGTNRDCYNDNIPAVNRQNKNIKIGIVLIFSSAILLSLLFFVNLTLINPTIMTDKNEISAPVTPKNNDNSGSSSSDDGRRIPSTDPGQRATIEKGGNPAGTPLEKK